MFLQPGQSPSNLFEMHINQSVYCFLSSLVLEKSDNVVKFHPSSTRFGPVCRSLDTIILGSKCNYQTFLAELQR